VRAALFVAHKHMLKARFETGDFIIDMNNGTAWVPEDNFYALSF